MSGPWLKVTAQFVLKDMPKRAPGVRMASYSFPAKAGPVPLHELAMSVLTTLIGWYGMFTGIDELREEFAKLQALIAASSLEPEEGEVSHE